MTKIITGNEPQVKRKGLDYSAAFEAHHMGFPEADARKRFNIPEEARCIKVQDPNYDLMHYHFVWFEVTL
jgi:hypothetical protein